MRWIVGVAALLMLSQAGAQIPETPEIPGLPPAEPPTIPSPGPGSPPAEAPGVPDPSLPILRTGNGSTEPGAPIEEYQHQIWHDGRHAGAASAGYDLIDLRAWEVDDYELGGGIVMRLELAGSAFLDADQYVIQGNLLIEESNATPILLLWTEDGATWSSDQTILSQNVSASEGGLPLPSAPSDHVIHLFMHYDALNATIGQTIAGWKFTAYADVGNTTSKTDVAPGGYFLAPQVELPEPNDGGSIDDESLSSTASAPPGLFLRGAGQHIDIAGGWSEGIATMVVSNPYADTPQEIAMAYPSQATPMDGTGGWLQPNSSQMFRFELPQQASAYTVAWDVRSSIGGVAQVQVTVPALPPPPAPVPEPAPEPEPEPQPVPLVRTDPVVEPPAEEDAMAPEPSAEPDGEESPGLGVFAVVAIAIALWARKR